MPDRTYGATTETELLLAFLAVQRRLGAVITHCRSVEQEWVGAFAGAGAPASAEELGARHHAGFQFGEGDTLAGALERYATTATATEAAIDAVADLGRAVPLPDWAKAVPWIPDGLEAWTVRWIREAIDGATMAELTAAVEGWPANDWIRPWKPA